MVARISHGYEHSVCCTGDTTAPTIVIDFVIFSFSKVIHIGHVLSKHIHSLIFTGFFFLLLKNKN